MIHARSSGHRVPAGFSLVEMAVVTLLIGIFLTLGLGALNVQRENFSASTTQKNLDAIRDAFVNYVRTNKRLPCPDTEPPINNAAPDGRENTTGGICTSAFGVLPYLDLGLTRESALDGWGNLYSYHVSVGTSHPDGGAAWNWSSKNPAWSADGPFLSTKDGNRGALTIKDRNASGLYDISIVTAAVVLSHGRNGLGAYTTKGTRIDLSSAGADELENTNGTSNSVYVRRTRDTDDPTGGVFDDYVMYLNAEDLLGPLVKEGSVKWADVRNVEDLARIRDATIGYAIAQLKLPSAPVISQDPWGNSYSITLGSPGYATSIGSGACITVNAFTAQSQSPGQALVVTCAELNGLLAKYGK